MYESETDWKLELVLEAYQNWLVQDELLFNVLLSSLFESMLSRDLGYKHA